MPYIKQEFRDDLDEVVSQLEDALLEVPTEQIDGRMNYFITKALTRVYGDRYFEHNRAIGLLECVQQEYYARRVRPYEDEKIKENGDVF